MITNPPVIVAVLICIEAAVLFLSVHRKYARYFRFLPAVFWIYFLPMLASTMHLIDKSNPAYQRIINNALPASLILLLSSCDIRAILRLGVPALCMMSAGSIGIIVGMPLVFFAVKNMVGPHMWPGFGALSGSWIGGSANMIAVKEAISAPDAVFAPMVIVDTVVPYVWMGILLSLAGMQPLYDRWNKSDRGILDALGERAAGAAGNNVVRWSLPALLLIIALAAGGMIAARAIAGRLPVVRDVFSAYSWTIIAASFIGIVISCTPARRLEGAGSTRIGYWMLYLALTCVGAKAGIEHVGAAVVLTGAGFLVVVFHAAVVIAAGRLIRAPMFLAAAASQANIGGVASAPVVAAVYQPGLAGVGLLLAIWGNITGTYLGILTAQLCRFVAR